MRSEVLINDGVEVNAVHPGSRECFEIIRKKSMEVLLVRSNIGLDGGFAGISKQGIA